jgi:hypothetical protein
MALDQNDPIASPPSRRNGYGSRRGRGRPSLIPQLEPPPPVSPIRHLAHHLGGYTSTPQKQRNHGGTYAGPSRQFSPAPVPAITMTTDLCVVSL